MVSNSLVQKPNGNGGKLSVFLNQDSIRNWINTMVGSDNGQRFITQLLSATVVNPDLAKCDQTSLISAALVGESLKLSPSPQLGQFYMVPFKDNKLGRTVATPVIEWKGYVQLAIRSGQYKRLNVLAIKEGELKRYDPLTEEITVELIEDDAVREQSPTIGCFAMFEYLNGFTKSIYWRRKKMEQHALRYSKAYAADKKNDSQKSFWTTDFDAQALKTMVRQLLSRWGVMSVEIQQAFDRDKSESENQDTFVSGQESVRDTPSVAPTGNDPFEDNTATSDAAEEPGDLIQEAAPKSALGEPDVFDVPTVDYWLGRIQKAASDAELDSLLASYTPFLQSGELDANAEALIRSARMNRRQELKAGK